jgi:hypothetical protein
MQDEYVGRPKNSVPVNVTISRPEAEWLIAITPGRTRGRFLSQLIAAERVRLEERRKLQSEMQAASMAG